MELFENMPTLLKAFWFIALPSSLIFLVQTVMTFMGADASDGIDADFDSNLEGTEAPFQLFSIRNLINFLLGFSWTGISYYDRVDPFYLVILATGVGSLFVFLFFIIIRQIQKLAEDNSFKLTDTLQKTAEVYLKIPESKSGKGKITISVRGSLHELDAMTVGEEIERGQIVKVTAIESGNILIVESI